MQQGKTSTKVVGVDVGKHWLDVAEHGASDAMRVSNTPAGISELIGWMSARGVVRVGMEASGGYERDIRQACDEAGLEVVVHQPLEVRLFARLKRLRAKNDRIDAVLIAAATAQVDTVRAAADPRLRDLAERLTVYERITDQLAQARGFMEHVTAKDLIADLKAQLVSLARLKAKLARTILDRIKACPDLAQRLKLLLSLPGIGPIVAASLIVRMPELGRMTRGQPAALLGTAPYDRDSGQTKGMRFIAGGRSRPRRMVYLAALSAKRYDPGFKAFAEALANRGKPAKVILVAIMRKLIEAANLILSRGQPWVKHSPA
jgi:transposase